MRVACRGPCATGERRLYSNSCLFSPTDDVSIASESRIKSPRLWNRVFCIPFCVKQRVSNSLPERKFSNRDPKSCVPSVIVVDSSASVKLCFLIPFLRIDTTTVKCSAREIVSSISASGNIWRTDRVQTLWLSHGPSRLLRGTRVKVWKYGAR